MGLFGSVFGAVKGLLGKGGPLATAVGLKIGDEVQDKEAERRNALARIILYSCIGISTIILALSCI